MKFQFAPCQNPVSDKLDEKDKYQVFLGGNHPIVKIDMNKRLLKLSSDGQFYKINLLFYAQVKLCMYLQNLYLNSIF